MFCWRSIVLTFMSVLSLSLSAMQIEEKKNTQTKNAVVKLVLPDSQYKSQINFFLTREWIFGKDFFIRDVKTIFDSYTRAMVLDELSATELHCYYKSSVPNMFDKAASEGAVLVAREAFKKRLDELPKVVQWRYTSAVVARCAAIWKTMFPEND